MIIAFEGIDGSGKSTIAKRIASLLNGIYLSYPTKKYKILERYLRGEVDIEPKALFHTFLADILNDQKSLISDKPVIIDRYVLSTIAYEINGGYTYDERKDIIKLSKPIIPDKIVFLNVDPKVCIKRIEHRVLANGGTFEKYDELKYLNEIKDGFKKLFDERFLTKNWIEIKGKEEFSETVLSIYEKIKQ